MTRSARVAVRILCSAAVLSAAPVWAQLATPEEVQSPLLVLQHLPRAPSHDRIQVKTYDFKELGAPSDTSCSFRRSTTGRNQRR